MTKENAGPNVSSLFNPPKNKMIAPLLLLKLNRGCTGIRTIRFLCVEKETSNNKQKSTKHFTENKTESHTFRKKTNGLNFLISLVCQFKNEKNSYRSECKVYRLVLILVHLFFGENTFDLREF